MSERPWMLRLAHFLRRNPWMVVVARRLWQFTRPKFSMGVVGVLFNEEGRVLLVEHVFHPYTPWGLPGGWVERNERPAVTLRRELQEELMLDAEVGPVLAVDSVDPGHVDLAYLCYPRGTIGTLCHELLGYAWYDPAQLPRTHAFHRAAIERAQELRRLAVGY